MFSTKESERFFHESMNEHLCIDDRKFREFFRVNQQQFYSILSLVEEDAERLMLYFGGHDDEIAERLDAPPAPD